MKKLTFFTIATTGTMVIAGWTTYSVITVRNVLALNDNSKLDVDKTLSKTDAEYFSRMNFFEDENISLEPNGHLEEYTKHLKPAIYTYGLKTTIEKVLDDQTKHYFNDEETEEGFIKFGDQILHGSRSETSNTDNSARKTDSLIHHNFSKNAFNSYDVSSFRTTQSVESSSQNIVKNYSKSFTQTINTQNILTIKNISTYHGSDNQYFWGFHLISIFKYNWIDKIMVSKQIYKSIFDYPQTDSSIVINYKDGSTFYKNHENEQSIINHTNENDDDFLTKMTELQSHYLDNETYYDTNVVDLKLNKNIAKSEFDKLRLLDQPPIFNQNDLLDKVLNSSKP